MPNTQRKTKDLVLKNVYFAPTGVRGQSRDLYFAHRSVAAEPRDPVRSKFAEVESPGHRCKSICEVETI